MLVEESDPFLDVAVLQFSPRQWRADQDRQANLDLIDAGRPGRGGDGP